MYWVSWIIRDFRSLSWVITDWMMSLLFIFCFYLSKTFTQSLRIDFEEHEDHRTLSFELHIWLKFFSRFIALLKCRRRWNVAQHFLRHNHYHYNNHYFRYTWARKALIWQTRSTLPPSTIYEVTTFNANVCYKTLHRLHRPLQNKKRDTLSARVVSHHN